MDATACSWDKAQFDQPIDLLDRRRIYGERMMLANVTLHKGCRVASHFHESEQLACVMSGRVRWGIGAEGSADYREFEMGGGEVMVLPSNVPHSVLALEETHIIDVLSPPAAMGIDNQRT